MQRNLYQSEMTRWARCNRDGKPIHPNDQKVIDEFAQFLRDRKEQETVRVVDLSADQWVTVSELRKELRGEKEIATTPADASLLLVAIATEIHSLHDSIKEIRKEINAISI